MIFDRVEWGEHNLDHATRRLTTAEIEQAIWNADVMTPHGSDPERALFRAVTDGGKAVVIIVQIVRDGVRPIAGMGGLGMTDPKSEAELADYYNRTQDLTGFEQHEPEPVTVKRNITISVRFSEEEIAELRARAEQSGVKVTSFIRTAALEASRPVDRAALGELARDLEQRAHQFAEFVARGA